jgi:tRNA threonylcarbamoyladenosine biosynthesis protein TsaB
MLILAFDCTMAACSVGLWRDGAMLASSRETMERGHAEALAPLVADCMARAGLGFPALTRVAVTVGPGSFTGVRVGLAMARGLALTLAIPAVGVTGGEALSWNAAREGTVISLIDTKRGDLYAEAFAADGTRRTEATTTDIDAVPAWIATQALPGPITLVGDGAGRISGRCEARVDATRAVPTPEAIAAIAATRAPSAQGPLPLYVRAPAVTVS